MEETPCFRVCVVRWGLFVLTLLGCLGTGWATSNNTQQTVDYPGRTVVVDYFPADPYAPTVYDLAHLQAIQLFESRLMAASQYSSFCLRLANSTAGQCAPPQSVVSLAFGGSVNLSNSSAPLLEALLAPSWRPVVGPNFPAIQTKVRSFFRFGGPLTGFASAEQNDTAQNELFQLWFNTTLGPLIANLSAELRPVLQFAFRGGPFRIYETEWAAYLLRFNITIAPGQQSLRFQLFKDNAKRVEYLASLRPGSIPESMFFPYMHFTNSEFFSMALNLPPGSLNHPLYLFWNIRPDMSDFSYPP
eukprot:RCo042632